MYRYYSPLFTLTFFALFNNIWVVQCQICDPARSGGLPLDWPCDDTPHVISKDKQAIESYCGYKISSILPKKTVQKVSNGRSAFPGELPFVAAIAYKGMHLCGAALIDNYHLVTAAHCILFMKYDDPNGDGVNPKDLKVQMGTIYRYGTKASEDSTDKIIRAVERIDRHINYEQGYVDRKTRKTKKGGYGGSDIAIITLEEPMPYTRNIWPVCLGSKDLVLGAANQLTNPVILSGFGQDKNRDVKNVKLQVSQEIRLLEKDECEKSINDHLGYEFKNGQICTVGAKEEKTTGACKGDSGGPLVQSINGRHYILGIVSYGPGDCLKGSTNNPDVYTDARYFNTWIDGKTTQWRYSSYKRKKCEKETPICKAVPKLVSCSRELAEKYCPITCVSDLPANNICAKKEESTQETDENLEITDCVWSSYGNWSHCSVTCGQGTRTATRNVVQKETNGGDSCTGSETKSEMCNGEPCKPEGCQDEPIPPNCDTSESCSDFAQKGDCEKTWRWLFRICDGSTPGYVKDTCRRSCNVCNGVLEPKDCMWSSYSNWTLCSTTCGQGVRIATRSILQQAENTNASCIGSKIKSEACNKKTCPVKTDTEKANSECLLVEDCDFYAWFINDGDYGIRGFPKQKVDTFLREAECGLDEEGNVLKVNCPIERLEQETGNGTAADCEKSDAVGIIKIVHANPNDITDLGYFVLPTEKKPKQTSFPNFKRGQPILKGRIIISMEATGICFCWELHETPRYRGNLQHIYPGDKIYPETSPGAIRRVPCPEEDYY